MSKRPGPSVAIGFILSMLANAASFAADNAGSIEKQKPLELGVKPSVPKPADALAGKAKGAAKAAEGAAKSAEGAAKSAEGTAKSAEGTAKSQAGNALASETQNEKPAASAASNQTPYGRPINDIRVAPNVVTPAKSKAAAAAGTEAASAQPSALNGKGQGAQSQSASTTATPAGDPLEERIRGLLQEKLGRDGEVVLRVSPDTPAGKTSGASEPKERSVTIKKASPEAAKPEAPSEKDAVQSARPSAAAEIRTVDPKVSASSMSRSNRQGSFAWEWEGARGPQAWGRLDPSYATCSSGKLQSPPKITEAQIIESTGPDLPSLNWRPQAFRWARQGPLWTAYLGGGSLTGFRGESFALDAIQFRFPGEPFVGDEPPAGSIHFIHSLGERRLIIALPLQIEASAARDPALTMLLRRFPLDDTDSVGSENLEVHLSGLLASRLRGAILFSGSLSYPPCTESVIWAISRQSLSLPEDQLLELVKLIGTGGRPVQPLNHRPVIAISRARS